MIDRLFGVFLLCLGLYVLYGGLTLEVPFSYDPLGPTAFPIALGIVLAILSVFVIAKPKEVHFPNLTTNLKTILIVVLLFFYQFSFDFLGFLLATALLVFCISKIFKGTTPQALASSVGVSGVVYLIFSVLLEVPLPSGVLFAKLLGA
ncbi:tripartite tricarboxylate transporter TctB family protein [Sulfurospirillum barnesii]|uniref:Tripartite tricarboxylate transporter TctB family n=1 Tax=Sulfurospirillum barnesii (strain ATCC 700032 / DSM 10660 / SES-3) TaxID=760154 RepID=I3XVE4_SULBS|nr:tripartite tricarboxylate transporter TctB family protein [Sulfurospirillum barnesii]AFL67918.1 Tripartite tricarboxylate transporter TctB family [Sulfurospirillum barnesii SES-3]